MARSPPAAGDVLALVPYTTASPPPFDAAMPAAARLAACQAYWSDPLAYSPNPVQLTAPLHGTVYGFIAYGTKMPAAGYDGSTLQTPKRLAGTRELWLTLETAPIDQVQPLNGGTVILDGKPDQGGFGVIHIPLTSPILRRPIGNRGHRDQSRPRPGTALSTQRIGSGEG